MPNNSKLPFEDEDNGSDIVAKIEAASKITLRQIYEEICRAPLERRLTLLQFKKILNELTTGKIES